MRQILLFLVVSLLVSNLSYAQENKTTENNPISISRQQLKEVVSENSFFNEKPAVFHPQCSSPRLLEKVLARIAQYYKEKPTSSIVEQRKQVLMQKKLNGFEAIDINSFEPKTNYAVADRLIDIKINDGVKAADMSLCKSTGDREIYLLIYPQNNFYTIEIINFPGQPVSKDFTTVYD